MLAAYLSRVYLGQIIRGFAKGLTIPPLLLLLIAPDLGYAQNQIVTEHFNIYFSRNAKETARRVAEIAEEVFAPLTSAFNAFDNYSRVHIFVHDDVDFSNGFANYYQNKVEIWASDLDFELRGAHNWIKGVVTHELAHIISLQVASRGIVNFGVVDFGQFNVNPDFSFTLPYLHLVTPTWYVEGVAQFATYEIGHDTWDSHRDMLLRMAVLEDDLLGYDEMGVFAGTGLHREMVYNQGFALLRYIQDNYGDGKVEALAHNTGLLSFGKSIKKVLGISPGELYQNWKADLVQHYSGTAGQIASTVRSHRRPRETNGDPDWEPYMRNGSINHFGDAAENTVEGKLIIDGGYLDYFPAVSPDGKKIAYISNEGGDFAITRLKLYDVTSGKVKDLGKRVNSRLSWTPDGKRLVYVRRKSNYNDLFIYDIDRRQEQRISVSLRAKDPAVSPDGKTIAFVRNHDGSTNLGLINIDGTDTRYLTNYNNGTQFSRPMWSPDGSRIAFSMFLDKDRDIGTLRADSPTFAKASDAPDSVALEDPDMLEMLIHTDADERDPSWLPDGSGLIFSADYGGIFNLYEYTFANGETRKRSAVLGGAFAASLSPDGNTLVYAGYHAANYNIYSLHRENFEERVALNPIERDYQSIYIGKPLSELFSISRPSKRLSVTGITPILGSSPSAVGNRFTISSINAGLQFGIGDLLGSDSFFGTAIVGKSLERNLELNYTLSGYYERRLPLVLTKDRALAPKGFAYGSKRVINDFFDLTTANKDTTVGDIVIVFGNGLIDTLRNVVGFINQAATGGDETQFDFTTLGAGFRFPINSSQTFGFRFEHKGYQQRVVRDAVFSDSSRFFLDQIPLPFGNLPFRQTIDAAILDTEFFSSNDLHLTWDYSKFSRTVDALLSPTGGRRIHLGYARLNSTVTDSLVQVNGALPGPSNAAVRTDFPINRYTLFWQEYIRMPFRRHTFGLETLMIYQDQRLPEFSELTNIDGFFPLRLYLGGQYTLKGYPYFTQNGSKMFYSRANYTFPIFKNIGKQLFNFYLDRLYGSIFFEAGTTWNFDKISVNNFKEAVLLYDAGLELRMSMFSFYRIPGTAYFQIAWPLRKIPLRNIDVTDQRIYFGIRLGGY